MLDTGNTTLYKRPETFNAVGVDIPLNIDFGVMVNPPVFVTNSSHSVVGGELISIESSITGQVNLTAPSAA